MAETKSVFKKIIEQKKVSRWHCRFKPLSRHPNTAGSGIDAPCLYHSWREDVARVGWWDFLTKKGESKVASKAYINTVASLAMAKIIGEYTWEVWAHRPKNKTMRRICTRIQEDAQAALLPYLNDASLCQYDKTAQRKVEQKLATVNRLFDSRGEDIGTWVNFNLAMLDDLAGHIKDDRRRAAVERLIYAVKHLARYVDRKMDDYRAYERAGELNRIWEAA